MISWLHRIGIALHRVIRLDEQLILGCEGSRLILVLLGLHPFGHHSSGSILFFVFFVWAASSVDLNYYWIGLVCLGCFLLCIFWLFVNYG